MKNNQLTIRLAGVVDDSIVDGPGIRFTIFTQGCFHNCPGCHNPQTHDPNLGYDESVDNLISRLDINPLLSGVTFSGGEPFLQPHPLAVIAKEAHKRGLNVISYTGYLYENLLKDEEKMELLKEVDYLIDGPFILALRDLELKYAGSRNQRIIDVKESLKENKTILKDL